MAAEKSKFPLQLRLILEKEPKLKYKKLFEISPRKGRSIVTIKEMKNNLIIEIKAKDATALRATTNSLMRDLQVIEATKI
jgi:hypothetical protein